MGDVRVTAEYLGWVATAVFTASYFCTRAEALRRVQMVGAVMWMAYGVLIASSPVIVSNALVLGAAAWTAGSRQYSVVSHRSKSSVQVDSPQTVD
jgi:inner membrane protein